MAAGGGISGVAVALAAAGGVLVYAGFQGQTPIQALKDISSGKARQLVPSPSAWANDPTRLGSGAVQVGYSSSGGFGGRLLAAAMTHRGEKYSQARRWETGFSDCSSFVGKALKDCGVTPPGGSTTGSYRVWKALRTVSRAEIQPGDLLCGPGHIALAVSATEAIGQQNGRVNVQVGPIEQIMYGQPSWVPRRYVGGGSSSGAGVAAA